MLTMCLFSAQTSLFNSTSSHSTRENKKEIIKPAKTIIYISDDILENEFISSWSVIKPFRSINPLLMVQDRVLLFYNQNKQRKQFSCRASSTGCKFLSVEFKFFNDTQKRFMTEILTHVVQQTISTMVWRTVRIHWLLNTGKMLSCEMVQRSAL